jgi:hypothetical protein
METLEISKENALAAYNKGSKPEKVLLENLFGKQAFVKNVMESVKTVKDACSLLDLKKSDYESGLTSEDRKSVEAYQKLIIIIRALNGGWEPDWENSNERKWYPWFQVKSGFGFSFTGYGYTRASTIVGSRLCFKSEELAEYAGKQFEEIYKEYLIK